MAAIDSLYLFLRLFIPGLEISFKCFLGQNNLHMSYPVCPHASSNLRVQDFKEAICNPQWTPGHMLNHVERNKASKTPCESDVLTKLTSNEQQIPRTKLACSHCHGHQDLQLRIDFKFGKPYRLLSPQRKPDSLPNGTMVYFGRALPPLHSPHRMPYSLSNALVVPLCHWNSGLGE